MDKKAIIVKRMQEELDCAHQGIIEPVAGESYMTVQYVYQMLKNSFEKASIPDHILDIFLLQDFPLSKFYDFFVDHDCFKTSVNWEQLSRDYAIYREKEFIIEQLHDKVQSEYQTFMKRVVDIAPYQIGSLITEISFKMQGFSIFRYQECFNKEDMNLLQGVEGILDKAYKKYSGEYLTPANEHYLLATAMECLNQVVEDERSAEDVLEDSLEA